VGAKADEIYIGGSELCLWNGSELTELETPDWDTTNYVALAADDRLVSGTRSISVSTEQGGWERIDTPAQGFMGLVAFRGDVYALSSENGVMRVYPGPAALLTKPLAARGMVALSDGIIAFGKGGVIAFDGNQWFDVQVPLCELGQAPL
jgi:hypothetical protein